MTSTTTPTIQEKQVENIIFITYNHGQRIECCRQAAILSNLVTNMIELFPLDDTSNTTLEVSLVDNEAATKACLTSIVQFLNYHKNDPTIEKKPSFDDDFDVDDLERTAKGGEPLNYWDRKFLEAIYNNTNEVGISNNGNNTVTTNNSRAAFYDLVIVAHFLQINPLIEAASRYLCRQISSKQSVQEVRNELNIPEDT